MAKDKKNEESIKTGGIDISHLLPKGYEASDLVTVGGLRPIAAAATTYEQKSPIVGYLLTVLDMPPRPSLRDATVKEPWQALLVRLTGPTMAKVGEDIMKIEAGKDIIIPLTGSLRNNIDILGAAVDQVNVWVGVFQVLGQVDTGKPTEMWDYEVQVHKKPIARTGPFALFNRKVQALPPGQTADGTLYDRQTGEVAPNQAARA